MKSRLSALCYSLVRALGDEGIFMESEPTGAYIALVVQLRAATDGTWYMTIEGTHSAKAIPLVPLTLVVRLWRITDTEVLRGSIRLHGSDHWAPIQSNTQLEQLARAWLSAGRTKDGSSV